MIGTGTGDNYAYLVTDDKTKDSMVIDPAHPPEYAFLSNICSFTGLTCGRVVPVLKKLIDSGDINLKAIINTHQSVYLGFYGPQNN